jgi:hypothetical protein
MAQQDQLDPVRMACIEAALRPYAWRRMSVRAVARRLVEAIDGEVVSIDDDRVWMVERALSACRWRGLTVVGVARQAAAALESWHVSRQRLEIELAWLLDSSE